MGTLAAVGVDDDLSTGESRVAMRSADDELAGGVDMIDDVVVEEVEHLLAAACLHTWDEDVDDVVPDLPEHRLVVVEKFVVLGRHDDGMDTQRTVVVAILNSHLTLGVGTQVGHHLTLATDSSQLMHEQMRQVE